jgi:CBS domain containing-hemolysin-like protein
LSAEAEEGFLSFIRSLIRRKTHLAKGTDLTEEIHELMDEGQAKGLIPDEVTDMVYGVLDLKETAAHAVMVPRTEVISASLNATLGDIIDLVTEFGHTRIPIHKETIDHVVGILHAKDLLKLWGDDLNTPIPQDIIRDPMFVPETQKLIEILRGLREKKTHLTVVTDEYGGTAGIVTIEDILEEIVGDIMDEHDHEAPMLKILEDDGLLIDARLEIEKLVEVLNKPLPPGDYESVGGFVIHLLGKIPEVNDRIVFEDLEIIIKKADQRKIDQLLITRLSPTADPS